MVQEISKSTLKRDIATTNSRPSSAYYPQRATTLEVAEPGSFRGFDDPVELAFELLTRGFIWREDFQKLWDKDVEKGQKGMEMMAPILKGRKSEESTPKMPGVGGRERDRCPV